MSEERDTLSVGSRVLLVLGRAMLHALGATWRFRVVNGQKLTAVRQSGRGFIFALWHGHLLPLLWHHRGEGVKVLISEHRDGELVARTAESLGYGLIRGSTTRGASRALVSLVRELEAGKEIAITPDGPRGPAETFAPGALVAAQRCDRYILPVAISASRSWRLNGWDKFMIPKPFARITVAYGEPSKVLAVDARGSAAEAPRFERLMRDAVERARG
jgi:lysophospholipid acyltransferase (LPLAT)-like uncharacterized protein